jgi:hypothetical protein
MSRLFYHVMQDNVGNLLFGVSGTMRLAGTGTAATIYGDAGLSVVLPNPMTNHPSYGSFKCYLGPGSYDFYMAKSGYSFETLTGLAGGGSMANQDANAVAITGGQITVPAAFDTGGIRVTNVAANDVAGMRLDVTAGTSKHNLFCGGTAPNYFAGNVGIGLVPTVAIEHLAIGFASGQYALVTHPSTAGTAVPMSFLNNGAVSVGTITTNDSVTAYNTTSDARLKKFVETLTGALDVIQALRPVSFRWLVDDSPGVGFLAHEVAEIVDGVVTGTKDAVDEDGNIMPMQMDQGKLVVWLVSAVKELTQQVEMLTAQLAGR